MPDIASKPQILQSPNRMRIINPHRQIITSGLVGWWPLDDGTGSSTARDASGNGNTGTLSNMDPNTDWVEGGLDFDGSNDKVTTGIYPSAEGTVSICALVKFDTLSRQQFLMGAGDTPNNRRYYLGLDASNNFFCGIGNTYVGLGQQNTASGYGTGELHHLCMTRTGTTSGTFYVYSDGIEKVSRAYTFSGTSSYLFYMGDRHAGDSYPVDGIMRDVRIYNRTLTATEIAAIAAGQG